MFSIVGEKAKQQYGAYKRGRTLENSSSDGLYFKLLLPMILYII